MEHFINFGGKEANPAAFPAAKSFVREFLGIKIFYKFAMNGTYFIF